MPKLLSYFALYLTFTALWLFQTPVMVFAQSATPSSLPTTYTLPPTVSPISPIYTDLIAYNLFHTFSCLAIGNSVIGYPCLGYQKITSAQGIVETIPVLSQVDLSGGVLGTAGNLIGALYMNSPVKTVDYLGSIKQELGFVKEAHAQVVGSGAGVLNPILKLWQISRNIAYIVMILVFVIVGMLVMLRRKINPQTVVTAQAALPGLVLGLILITFSYFFAALLTDTAFVGVNVVGAYFSSAIGPSAPKGSLLQNLSNENVISIGSSFGGRPDTGEIATVADRFISALSGTRNDTNSNTHTIFNPRNIVKITIALMAYQAGAGIGAALGGMGSAILGAVGATATAGTSLAAAAAAAPIVATVGGPLVGTILAGAAFAKPEVAVGMLLYLVALFAVIYAIFRLFLALLSSYLSIIFSTITAPFQLLAAAMPGRQEIATTWARNMLANALTFPAVIAVFYFAAYLLGNNDIKVFGINQQLQLGNTGSGVLPLFGGINLSFINALLAFGAILATPKIPEIISRTIGKPGAGGQLIGQAIEDATNRGQRFNGQLTQDVGKTVGNVRDSWRGWKGQDPYPSGARKFIEKGGHFPRGVWGEVLKAQELKSPYENTTSTTGGGRRPGTGPGGGAVGSGGPPLPPL